MLEKSKCGKSKKSKRDKSKNSKRDKTQIEVGPAVAQTVAIPAASIQSSSYVLDFLVEADLKTLEQVKIHVLDPDTGRLLHKLVPNQQGQASCRVEYPGVHTVVLMRDGKAIETRDAMPMISTEMSN